MPGYKCIVNKYKNNLSSLYTWMKENGHDLIKFKAYIQDQRDALMAMGEFTNDLTVNLFKAYKTCPDEQFKIYIQGIQHAHEDDTAPIEPAVLI